MSPDAGGRDKRRFPRFDVSIPVIQRRKGGDVTLRTVDVSRHGAFVRLDPPLPLRQLVQLRFRLPELGDVDAMCMVARSLGRDHPRGPGVGVDFFALSKEAKNTWERFITNVKTGALESDQAFTPTGPTLVQGYPLFPSAPPQTSGSASVRASAPEIPLAHAPPSWLETTAPLATASAPAAGARGPVTSMMAALQLTPEPVPPPRALATPPPPPVDDGPPSAPNEGAVVMLRVPDRESLRALVQRDIARGGMFLKTPLVKEVGEKIAVVIVHPETDEEFHLDGTVVRRVLTGPPDQRGLGIFFRALAPEREAHLHDFVDGGFEVVELGTPVTQMQLDLEAAVAREPDSAEALEALGVYLLDDEGDLGGALTALTRALVLGPSVVSIHASLARAYRKIGDTVKVRSHERVAESLMLMQERMKVRLGVGEDA
jgi:Tfp pilus assembly protein PilZ